jgi:large conductance mechanosensitive channel
MSMLREFKEFALKGNVVDMAVGIIIGAAFTTVVKSLVDDVIMPPLGMLSGGLDFSNQFWVIRAGDPPVPYATPAEAAAAGATALRYGQLLNSIVSFTLVAAALFSIVRWINRLRRPDAPPAPGTKPCPFCTSEIAIKAIRCPQCTSMLDEKAEDASAASPAS